MAESVCVDDTRAKFCCLAFLGSNDGVFRLMLVKSHFLDRNISYTQKSKRVVLRLMISDGKRFAACWTPQEC